MSRWSRHFEYVIISLAWNWDDVAEPGLCASALWLEKTFIPQMPPGQTLLLIGQVPYFHTFSFGCDKAAKSSWSSNCFPFFGLSTLKRCNNMLKDIAKRYPSKVVFWHFNEIICPDRGFCSPWIAYKPQYGNRRIGHAFNADPSHISDMGALYATLVTTFCGCLNFFLISVIDLFRKFRDAEGV
jgi:hypothetical protein